MQNKIIYLLLCMLSGTACQKSETETQSSNQVTTAELERISALGFNTDKVHKIEGGFIVEGDILISNKDLLRPETFSVQSLKTNEEHYRHVNLVTGLPRVISIRVHSALPASYITATNAAIARYNALGLNLTFTRVTTGGDIVINGVTGTPYLSMSGFPSGGNPYSNIALNRSHLDTWAFNTVTSVIAHAIGHCIGFYHTDHYSAMPCNNDYGAISIIPPIHIPGTPLTGGGWMSGCIGNGVNRPFTADDVLALTTLY